MTFQPVLTKIGTSLKTYKMLGPRKSVLDLTNSLSYDNACSYFSFQVFNPRTYNISLESVKQDGMGVISDEAKDQCLDTETVVDKCYRVFVSGLTVGDQTGDWSIGE